MYGSALHRVNSADGCMSAPILFKYEFRMGHLFVQSWARVRRVALRVLLRNDVG